MEWKWSCEAKEVLLVATVQSKESIELRFFNVSTRLSAELSEDELQIWFIVLHLVRGKEVSQSIPADPIIAWRYLSE